MLSTIVLSTWLLAWRGPWRVATLMSPVSPSRVSWKDWGEHQRLSGPNPVHFMFFLTACCLLVQAPCCVLLTAQLELFPLHGCSYIILYSCCHFFLDIHQSRCLRMFKVHVYLWSWYPPDPSAKRQGSAFSSVLHFQPSYPCFGDVRVSQSLRSSSYKTFA